MAATKPTATPTPSAPKPANELEAIQLIHDVLVRYDDETRFRMLTWVCSKLNIKVGQQ